MLSQEAAVRAIVLAGRGRNFCAGADLDWMQQQAAAGYDANLEDARAPGVDAAHAGAVAQADRRAGARCGARRRHRAGRRLRYRDRRPRCELWHHRGALGLTPSTIAPYVIGAIGERSARRYFLSGERFDAEQALRIGLIHEAVDGVAIDARLDGLLADLRSAGPAAQAHCKRLLAALRGHDSFDPQVAEQTARSIAEVRAGAEAREGIAAFFAKRKPGRT